MGARPPVRRPHRRRLSHRQPAVPVTPGLALNLSVSYFAARSGIVHEGVVLPDEEVPCEWILDEPKYDPVVRRAMRWIGYEEQAVND